MAESETSGRIPAVASGIRALALKDVRTVQEGNKRPQVVTKANAGAASGKPYKQTAATKKAEEAEAEKARETQGSKSGGSDLIRWSGGGGISFFVKPTQIQGAKDITISAAPETEDKDTDGEKYTSLKSAGKIQVTINAVLMAALGAKVETMVNRAVLAARAGETGYLYIAGKKLFTPQFMLTKADAKNIRLLSNGTYMQCEIGLTFTQASKYDGTLEAKNQGGGGGGGTKQKLNIADGSGKLITVTPGGKNNPAITPVGTQAVTVAQAQQTAQAQQNAQTARATVAQINSAKGFAANVLENSRRSTTP